MILSSADILRVLGADAIVRQEARLSVVEGRPGLDIGDSVYIYVDKYPTIDEFEATWKIWVTDNSGMGEYVLNAMTSLLPNFEFVDGHYVTRDFASERTVVKTEAEKQLEQLAAERQSIKEDFSGLQEGVEARLSTVRDGRDGIDGRDGLDGRDGRDGKDGRDGQDLDATEVELFDLKDVEESPIPLKKGQVLTWDGEKWTNLYVRQTTTYVGGGSGSGGGGTGGQINSDTITSDTAPTQREDGKGALRDGDTWWKSDTGQLFVYYVDGDAGQWVEIDTGEGGGGGIPLRVQSRSRNDLTASPTNVVYNVSALSFDTDSGFEVQDLSDGTQEAFIKMNSTFNPWQVDGQDDLRATGEEPVEFVAGPGVRIRTDATTEPKQIIIEATGGGGGGGGQCDGILDGGNADDGTSNGVDCPDPGIEEAPEDGQQYARQDGAWQVVETGTGDVEEAPMDGNFYVRHYGAWVDLRAALGALGVMVDESADGGNFTTGQSVATNSTIFDAGNFTTGESVAIDDAVMDGGNFSGSVKGIL